MPVAVVVGTRCPTKFSKLSDRVKMRLVRLMAILFILS